MKHAPSRTPILFLLALSLVLSGYAVPAEGQSNRSVRAQGQPSARAQASAVSQRAAPRPAPRPRRPGSLMGSAANVRPGFYQQLNAPRVSPRRGPYRGPVAPVYVYLEPPVYHSPAPRVAPEPAPAPAAPQPIYIVNPAPAAAAPAAPTAPAAPPPPPEPRSTEPGEIKISVLPADARVYLDDDFLGTGAELASLEAPQLFPPGVHVLEVTHPDYRPQRLVFGVSHKDPTHVLVDLSVDRVGRRSRIK